MARDKTLGLDDFTMGFLQVCWEVINDDLTRVFQEFQANEKFEKKSKCYFFSSHS